MKRALTIVIVLAVVTAGALWANTKLRAASPTNVTTYKISKVEIGTVKKTVSATGVIQPWAMVDIKSKAGGRVDALLVDVGSRVSKGTKIALIDPADTRLQVDQARADIQTADARIQQSMLTVRLQKEQSRLAVEQAETALAQSRAAKVAAQARLKTSEHQMNAQPGLTSASVASARANLENAEKQLAEMREATLPQERAAANSALAQAQANLKNADANLNRQKSLMDKGFVSQQVVDSALANRDVVKAQVESAQQKLDTLDREQAASEAAMVARVSQARAQLANAQAAGVDVDVRKSSYQEALAAVKQADRAIDNAQKSLDLATANLANVQIRETDILSANASKFRAQAGMVNAQKTLDQTVVTAPTEGVVLKKYVEQGTIISSALSFAATGNNIVQIGDVSRMYVDVTVDETDIANVDEGQTVDITIEAYPTASMEGKVTRIDPQALVESNVTNIHVRVELDQDNPLFRLLKPGMNATCEFVKSKKENVIAVPSEAIRSDDKGSYVEIAVGGKPAPPEPKSTTPPDPNTLVDVKPQRRDIKVDLEGNDSVEVVEGLKEGDTIITQTIEPVVQQAGGAMGGNRMGGFGGRR